MQPTPGPIDPDDVRSKIDDVVDQAKDAYNALPETARNIITVGVAIACVLAVLNLVGSIVGRLVSLAIAAVAIYFLWKYLPNITDSLGITGI